MTSRVRVTLEHLCPGNEIVVRHNGYEHIMRKDGDSVENNVWPGSGLTVTERPKSSSLES